MKVKEFIEKLKYACEVDTLYVMGCFGAPMTTSNKERYKNNHSYNRNPKRQEMINNTSSDTFGFDCVNLIKGILWGWCGDKTKVYGGAKYATNGVPDISADQFIKVCKNVSTDFSDNLKIGECVWMNGHVGVYIGNDEVIECTPAFKNKVQITKLNQRKWLKHGLIPYIDYTEDEIIIPEMQKMIDKGYIKGYGNGKFGPKDPLTREQLCIILNNMGLI